MLPQRQHKIIGANTQGPTTAVKSKTPMAADHYSNRQRPTTITPTQQKVKPTQPKLDVHAAQQFKATAPANTSQGAYERFILDMIKVQLESSPTQSKTQAVGATKASPQVEGHVQTFAKQSPSQTRHPASQSNQSRAVSQSHSRPTSMVQSQSRPSVGGVQQQQRSNAPMSRANQGHVASSTQKEDSSDSDVIILSSSDESEMEIVY